MRVLALVLVLLGVSAGAGEAIYKPKEYVARYCSPTGDICLGIFESSGGFVFQVMTVEKYFARYKVCVQSPRGARKCRTAPINPQGRVYGSHVRWPRHFGDRRPGVYRVTWSHAGQRLGPTLRFTRR